MKDNERKDDFMKLQAQQYKKYFFISLAVIAVYAFMQVSGLFLLDPFHQILIKVTGNATIEPVGPFLVVSAVVALLVILILTRDKGYWYSVFNEPRKNYVAVVGWGIIGFILVLVGQGLAAYIETTFLGIEMGSENTAQIFEAAKAAPIIIVLVAIIGPILEEFVFRRSIFGTLLGPTNFVVAALISSLAFAVIHFDFTHLLVYLVSGFIFATVYYKSRSIWAPIIAHMLLNTFVTFAQFFGEDLQNWAENVEQFIFFMP